MITATAAQPRRPEERFRHVALLYAGPDSFLEHTTSFIRAGLAGREPMLVVVRPEKIELLQTHLGRDANDIHFADMAELGRNPARIIPAWREFVNAQLGGHRHIRGIGEPIWAGRSPAEVVECQHHESLLNLAFAQSPAWSLLCPYDTEAVDPAVIEEACRSHPFIIEGGGQRASTAYRGVAAADATLEDRLSAPPSSAEELVVNDGSPALVRSFAARHAWDAGLSSTRTADFVFCVNEVVTNSLRHAGGAITVSIWRDEDFLIGEVRDRGHITQPLLGRERPTPDQERGRGLWLVNQLCDLVQVRSFATGTVVRMYLRRAGSG